MLVNPFNNQPLPGERRARAAEISEEWRIARHGVEVVAHGALICPGCDAPITLPAAIPVQERLECGFCGHSGRAHKFMVKDIFDTVSNEAYMVARIPMRVS